MPRIRVLKPFVFTSPAAPGLLTAAREEAFHHKGGPNRDGVYELADDHPMFTHPWYASSYCDGKVESPQQAEERLAAEKVKQDAIDAERVEQQAKANIAAGRQVVTSVDGGSDQAKSEVEANLNTPISELRARQGQDLVTTGPKLRAGQTKAAKPAEANKATTQ